MSSYRYAKPGKASRKVVRLVTRIEEATYETSKDLPAARQLENEWIRLHRPRYNSVNVHPETNLMIGLSKSAGQTILRWTRSPEEAKNWEDTQVHGAFRSRVALRAMTGLRRLVWWHDNSGATIHDLPHGWLDGNAPRQFKLDLQSSFGKASARIRRKLSQFWVADSAALPNRLGGKSGEIIASCKDRFLRDVLERDRQSLLRFHQRAALRNRSFRAIARLPRKEFIGQAQLDDFFTVPLN